MADALTPARTSEGPRYAGPDAAVDSKGHPAMTTLAGAAGTAVVVAVGVAAGVRVAVAERNVAVGAADWDADMVAVSDTYGVVGCAVAVADADAGVMSAALTK